VRALVQRVSRAKVHIRRAGSALGADLSGHAGVSSIGWGLTAFVGVGHGDGPEQARSLAHKMAALRIFEDETGRMNRSLIDTGGSVLAVSQFTLYADLRKGNRPSFGEAAPPDVARDLFVRFVTALRELGVRVETGVFGADMDVELVNDGPVTMWLDTARFGPRRDPP
jgi:D-tyrosyl-tRNA(Tyr) deacylase